MFADRSRARKQRTRRASSTRREARELFLMRADVGVLPKPSTSLGAA